MKTQTKFNNLLDVAKRFPTEESCREFLEQMRWNGKPVCPHCGNSEKMYRIQSGKLLKCAVCRKPFFVKIGPVLRIPLCPCRNGFMQCLSYLLIKKVSLLANWLVMLLLLKRLLGTCFIEFVLL